MQDFYFRTTSLATDDNFSHEWSYLCVRSKGYTFTFCPEKTKLKI